MSVPAQVEVPSKPFYRPELDVVRFLAFLAVFIFHASNFASSITFAERVLASSGEFGLCLFFVLSSYLITELLIRERDKTGAVHIKAFYVRRILRIWPLYFGFIALSTLIGAFHKSWRMPGEALLAFLFLAANWYILSGGQPPAPVAPLWSISLEEQFYLLWPAIAKWKGRLGITVLAVVLIIGSILAALIFPRGIWFNSFVQFQFFGIGALLAIYSRRLPGSFRTPQRMGLLILALAFWIAAGYWVSVNPNSSIGLLSLEFAAAACICLMIGMLDAPARWFPPALLRLGRISYGLYVFHMLALLLCHMVLKRMSWLTVAVAFASTILCALISYRCFETPFLRLKERFTYVLSRAV